MTWLIYALISVALFTTLNLLQRVLSIDTKNPRAAAIVFNLIAAFFAILIFIFTGSFRNMQLSTSVWAWAGVIIAGLLYALFERLRFSVNKLLDASTYSTVSSIDLLIGFLLSALIYQEAITPSKIIGLVLIMVAIFAVSYEKNKSYQKKGILLGLISFSALGMAWSLDKFGTQNFNAATYSILVWVAPLYFIYAFPRIKLRDALEEIKIARWKLPLLAGVNVLGYFLQLKALELADATTVIPIIQTCILTTVLLGIVLLKERDKIGIKIFAGILALLGVYFLA